MSDGKIEIRRVDVEEVIDLRHRVLRTGLPRKLAHFEGDDSPGAAHFAAYENGTVIGCATFLVNQYEGSPAGQLRGMAVDPGRHQSGIGRQLLAAVEQWAIQSNLSLLWANCRTPARGFYQKLGWEAVSEEFEIPTAGPHYRMIKKMKNDE